MVFAQVTNGVVDAILEAELAPTVLPQGRIFVAIPDAYRANPHTLLRAAYDAATGTFTPYAPPTPSRLSHADMLALLTPAEWSDLNRFHPEATGQTASGTLYSDAQMFWAVSVFNKSAYVDLKDPRVEQILQLLQAKGVLTAARADTLKQQMAAKAAEPKA